LFLPKQDIFTGKTSKQLLIPLSNLILMQNPELYKDVALCFERQNETFLVLLKNIVKLGSIEEVLNSKNTYLIQGEDA